MVISLYPLDRKIVLYQAVFPCFKLLSVNNHRGLFLYNILAQYTASSLVIFQEMTDTMQQVIYSTVYFEIWYSWLHRNAGLEQFCGGNGIHHIAGSKYLLYLQKIAKRIDLPFRRRLESDSNFEVDMCYFSSQSSS